MRIESSKWQEAVGCTLQQLNTENLDVTNVRHRNLALQVLAAPSDFRFSQLMHTFGDCILHMLSF